MRKMLSLLALAAAFLSLTPVVEACRIVVRPPRPMPRPVRIMPIQVKSHQVSVKIKDQVAITTLRSQFYNPNRRQLEGTYLMPLPKGANISDFSLWIDGKERKGELLDEAKARRLYVNIVRKMIDPGLLEFVGMKTIKLRVFPIPARGTRQVKLTFTQLLKSDSGLMRYTYPLTTVGNGRRDTLGKLSLSFEIDSSVPIQSVFSPSHTATEISKKGADKVIGSFEKNNVHPDRDFVLYMTRSTKKIGLNIVAYKRKSSKEGYFLMMIAPNMKYKKKAQLPKDIVFVVDTSGSMQGQKIKQARSALKFCLQSLNKNDRFNIVPFSTESRSFKDQLVKNSEGTVKEALTFIEDEVIARGGTNIGEALDRALKMTPKKGNRPFMVVFLTDGIPTVGELDINQILKNAKKHNAKNLRLFVFGVGSDVNTHLLDKLADQNQGAREYVVEGENIEIKVSNFYSKVSSPVVSDLKLKFDDFSPNFRVTDMTPRRLPDLFFGSQIAILGRYKGEGSGQILLSGMAGDEKKEFTFAAAFPEVDKSNQYLPRLWAGRKIAHLLDHIRLKRKELSPKAFQELKREVVRLAKKFGILTPYTSYLVLEDMKRRPARQPGPGGRRGTGATAPRENALRRALNEKKSASKIHKAKADAGKATGQGSVDLSRRLQKMKEQGYDSDAEGKDGIGSRMVRKVDDKTFYRSGKKWVDSVYNTKIKTAEKVTFLSKEYFALLKKKPEIAPYLGLGKDIIVVLEGVAYEITRKKTDGVSGKKKSHLPQSGKPMFARCGTPSRSMRTPPPVSPVERVVRVVKKRPVMWGASLGLVIGITILGLGQFTKKD